LDGNGNPVVGPGARQVSAQDAISYNDAFNPGLGLDLATTYDLNHSTTVLGRFGYAKSNGQRVDNGTVTEGGVTAPLFAEFDDLEQYTIEGGIRKYVGGGILRPYVGATGGFTYTDDLNVTQTSTAFAGGPETLQYVDGGWSPTAALALGAEMAVGPRTAIGVEAGLRWSDNLDTATVSQDRWSIPVSLRGRVAF